MKERKIARVYKNLLLKYALIVNVIDSMDIDNSAKYHLKTEILTGIKRMKKESDSLELAEDGSKKELLYLLGIEVNEFNKSIREFNIGSRNLDVLEDTIDFINYKLGKYLKV